MPENRVLAQLASAIKWFSGKVGAVRPTRKRLSRWAYSLTSSEVFRLLDIYVLRGFWFFFSLVLLVFVSLFIIVTLFELLPDIVKNNVDTIVISYFVFLLPQILYYVIPLTVLLAITYQSWNPHKTNEILAVKAGAISLYRMAMPLCSWPCCCRRRHLLSSGFHAAVREPTAGRISERDQGPCRADIS
jgi:hypothetical protein